MRKWGHNNYEVWVQDEKTSDMRRATPAEIIEAITSLQKRVADLEAQASERSWQTNPDRMGGQFTDEEISRRDTW
jgi:uncharacterized protein YlxW (UPF0749 family)